MKSSLSTPRRFSRALLGSGVCLILAAGIVQAGTKPAASDWPAWRGPNRDGLSQESGWQAQWGADGPKELWRVSVGIGFSSCSVAGGRLYTMGNKDGEDIVWCLNAETGKEIWSHRYPCRLGKYPGSRMTPTVDGDLVYTLSREGDLFCLGARDGNVKWSKKVKEAFGVRQTRYNWGFACSPLILGKLLILDLGKTLALDKRSGKLIWTSGNDEAGFSSPTTIKLGQRTYVNSFNAFGLVLVDAASGKEAARYKWETKYLINSASPIPWNGKIFISSGYGRGCALIQASGRGLAAVYENTNMRNHVNSCVLYKDHLYGFDGQQGSRGRLTCLDIATGEVVWSERGMRIGSLMIAGGRIVAMLDKGVLLVAEATTEGYREISRAKVLGGRCWTYPVLINGRIYCRSNDEGELVCFDVKAR